jgi:hypothetical protein
MPLSCCLVLISYGIGSLLAMGRPASEFGKGRMLEPQEVRQHTAGWRTFAKYSCRAAEPPPPPLPSPPPSPRHLHLRPPSSRAGIVDVWSNSPATYNSSIARPASKTTNRNGCCVTLTIVLWNKWRKEFYGRFPPLHRHQMDMKASWKSFHRVCSWFPAVLAASTGRRGECRWGEDVSPVDDSQNRWNTWRSAKESSVPYTPIKETKEEKALCTNIITGSTGEQIDECNLTFDTMEGWWHQHGITRSIERTRASCAIYKQWRREESRREAIKTAKADRIPAALKYTPTVLNCTVRAPQHSQLVKAPMAAVGMIFAESDSIFRGGRRRKHGNGGGPNTGGRGTVGRRYSILEGPTAPDLSICNESSRSPTVVPAAAPPARRGPACKSLTVQILLLAQEDLTWKLSAYRKPEDQRRNNILWSRLIFVVNDTMIISLQLHHYHSWEETDRTTTSVCGAPLARINEDSSLLHPTSTKNLSILLLS